MRVQIPMGIPKAPQRPPRKSRTKTKRALVVQNVFWVRFASSKTIRARVPKWWRIP